MLGKSNAPFFKNLLLVVFYCVVIAVALRYLYSYAATALNGPFWLGAATVNSAIALFVFFLHKKLFKTRYLHYKKSWPWLDYSPLVLLIICGLLSFVSFLSGGATHYSVSLQSWLWVLWVPLAEELTFRVGFGHYFRSRLGVYWGSYCSILLFCLAHTVAAHFSNPVMWFTHIPLGVLLLGVCCEFIYVTRSKLRTIVFFHMAANFSVILFRSVDSRWLQWLSALYS